MYRFSYRAVLLAVAVLIMVGCANDSITNPTIVSPCPCTDGWSGTLSKNGAFTHSFNINSLGAVTASLIALAPNSAQIVGLQLGVWNGNSCTASSTIDTATSGSTITLNASSAGTLCVRLYDVGFITDPVLYQLQIVHP